MPCNKNQVEHLRDQEHRAKESNDCRARPTKRPKPKHGRYHERYQNRLGRRQLPARHERQNILSPHEPTLNLRQGRPLRQSEKCKVCKHSVDGLTTQAQRPGARDATIATATLPPGSLQRMVRCFAHCDLFGAIVPISKPPSFVQEASTGSATSFPTIIIVTGSGWPEEVEVAIELELEPRDFSPRFGKLSSAIAVDSFARYTPPLWRITEYNVRFSRLRMLSDLNWESKVKPES